MDISEQFKQPAAIDNTSWRKIDLLLPKYSLVPDEFKRTSNKYADVISTWFFNGLNPETQFIPKKGIDTDKALRHIGTIMSSWNPKHEHKEAGCAFLLYLWFDEVKNYKKP